MMCRPTKFNFILINGAMVHIDQVWQSTFLNNNRKNLFLCGETFRVITFTVTTLGGTTMDVIVVYLVPCSLLSQ